MFNLTRFVLGATMHNLASFLDALGRHQDALVMQEKALEVWRRTLSKNHTNIGAACFNISKSYLQVTGDFHGAIERAREALRLWQATLPPSHPSVAMAQEWVHTIEGSLARLSQPKRFR